ncbi:MAG: tetratricopeptide repeat protein [Thermodesulfobacteriota bacterium]
MKFLRSALLLVILTAFAISAVNRNALWNDEVRLWEDIAKKSLNKARWHNNLSVIYLEKRQIDKAMVILESAIKLHAADRIYGESGYLAAAHSNLGLAYAMKGRMKEATSELITAIELSPDYVKARINLGNVYDELNLIDEAIREYKTAISIDPNDAAVHQNLGLAYLKKGLKAEAMASFETVLRINPENEDIRKFFGSVKKGQN